jgi:hypothetical protein
MESHCPQCDAPLGPETMNIAEGVALCPECGKLSRLSEVVEQTRPLEELVDNPPPGCSISEWGDHTTLYATLRSGSGLLGSLFMAIFWNSITSVFVVIAMVGLYQNLIGPFPQWFPAPEFDDQMPLGMALFLCLFLMPFVLIGAIMIGAVFSYAFGRVQVTIDRHAAQVRTGFGLLNWTQRFDPNEVDRVEAGLTRWKSNDNHQEQIEIHADRTVKFGTMLTEARRDWLRDVLRAKLLRRDGNR